ncbi:hypothetical protein ACDA63_17105 [Uliginosibacterium sp. sgz301328]|uniref:hypothetical protein n=1 Tax=Uliginosibacterium sp. sgz301328 TaxID=3243764 RepID=UPI00359E15D3
MSAGIFSAVCWLVSAQLQGLTLKETIPVSAVLQLNMTAADANLYAAYAAAVAAFFMAIAHAIQLFKTDNR